MGNGNGIWVAFWLWAFSIVVAFCRHNASFSEMKSFNFQSLRVRSEFWKFDRGFGYLR